MNTSVPNNNPPQTRQIRIRRGTARAVFSDDLRPIFEALGGEPRIARASHVDRTVDLSPDAIEILADLSPVNGPLPDAWWASMLPVGFQVVLGPFDSHGEALAAESAWLKDHQIPVPLAIIGDC